MLGELLLIWINPRSPLLGAIFGVALVLPLLLMLWLARRMCYVMQRPDVAVVGSAAYFVLIAIGLAVLFYLRKISSFNAYLLMGAASAISIWLLLRRLGLPFRIAGEGVSWRSVLRENWKYGRWLVASTVLLSITSQTQMFLAAVVLGLGAAGILRAMQLPSLLMTQIVMATGLLIIHAFAYDFGNGKIKQMRRKAGLVSFGLTGVALVFVVLLMLGSTRIEHLLYSGKYAQYAWLMALLALVPATNGFSIGYSMALRASQRPQFDLIANSVAAPVGLLSAIAFTHWWGLAGVASSMVLGFAVQGVVTYICFRSATPMLSGSQRIVESQDPATPVCE
jgi:O-antigen/teichoic acid export membrane protein